MCIFIYVQYKYIYRAQHFVVSFVTKLAVTSRPTLSNPFGTKTYLSTEKLCNQPYKVESILQMLKIRPLLNTRVL